MIPLELRLANFMCYRGDDTPQALSFDGLHVVCLSGENGAGKSALLDAITWALWGEARAADDDLIAQGASEMLVELTFQLGDQRYRVARRRQRGKTGPRGGTGAGKSSLDLQMQGEAGWRAIGETGVRETQEKINDLLRMSYQTFINASFLLQGRADEFTARTPAERKQVLADILDLGEYAALEAKAKERARILSDQRKGLRGKIEQLAAEAEKAGFWQLEVENATRRVGALRESLDQVQSERSAAEELLRRLEQKAELRKGLLLRLDELRNAQRQRDQEIVELRQRIGDAEERVARRDAIVAGVVALTTARAELDRLEGLRDRHDELTRRQNELRQQFSEAKGELRRSLGQIEQRHEQLEQRATRREAIQTEIRVLGERADALLPLVAARESCVAERQALTLRADQMAELQHRHDRLEAQIKLRQDSLVAVREEKQRVVKSLERQLADEPVWQQELAAARAATVQLADAENKLRELRAQEQADVDRVSHLRAECSRLKAAADKLKANQKILAEAGGSCPVCRSELGETGVAHVQEHYEHELAELRAGYAEAKREADSDDWRLKETRSAAEELERRLGDLRRIAAQQAPLETQIRQAETWKVERAAAQREIDDIQQQIAAKAFEPAIQAELAVVTTELAALGDAATLQHQRKLLDDRLRELEIRLHERGTIEGKRQALLDELARTEEELAALPALTAEIAELRRKIEENDFEHAIRAEGQEVSSAIAALGYSADAHTTTRDQVRDLARWEQEERELLLAEQRLDADRQLYTQAEQLRIRDSEEADRLTREDALLELELRGLPQAQARVNERIDAYKEAQRGLLSAEKDLTEKETYLKKALDAASDLAKAETDERAIAERHSLFDELAEAFGKKGVQAMLIETAIPQIEDEANRLLSRMTDNQMHLSLDTQRDTKKGDTVETLEIKIADTLGTRVYDAFSGGEAMRVNFAVRIALSRLLARRAGARLETLVIDEGFGTLDSLGRERMVEAITGVQDDFRRIIVITHIDELKERFPALIEVTKTAFGSRWELR